jgi:hypothetical protein
MNRADLSDEAQRPMAEAHVAYLHVLSASASLDRLLSGLRDR